MDEVKTERSLCSLCLSTSRKTYAVDSVSEAFAVVTNFASQAEDVRICWECKASLVRITRFTQQAKRALRTLKETQNGVTAEFTCLSNLSNSSVTFTDCTQYDSDKSELIPAEIQDEIKEENEFEDIQECNAWVDTLTELRNNIDVINTKPIDCDKKQTETVSNQSVQFYSKLDSIETNKKSAKTKTKHIRKKNKEKPAKVEKKRKPYTYSKSANELVKNLIENSKVEEFVGNTQDVLKGRRILLALVTGRFRCVLCIEKFKTREELSDHTKTKHSEVVGQESCDICSCRFACEASLAAHRAEHYRLFRCLYAECDFICSLPTRVVCHVRRHEQTDRPSVRQNTKCNICGGEFRSRAYYLIHRKIHLSQQRFDCDMCGKSYKTRPQIARHLKNHRLKYMCETCGKRCPSNSALKAHSLAHMDYALRDFECGECNKKFINKHKLLSHLKYHSGERPFKCTECHKEYTDVYQLNFHKKQQHEKSDNVKKSWKRTASLQRNKPLRMPMVSTLKETREKAMHECHICGKKFKDKVCLRTHFSVHSDARPYKCGECEKSFKVYAALYTHKNMHKGVKPHQCNICGAQFALKGNLTVHLRIHSDEKSYECNICKRKFKFPSNLSKHIKIHDVVVK